MKVRSRHSSRRQRVVRVVVVSLVALFVALQIPRVVSVISHFIMSPVHGLHVWLNESSSLVPSFYRDRKSLTEEIEDLKYQLVVASQNTLTQKRLLEENGRLRALLGAAEEDRVAAAVIARPNELPYDLLQIDRGRNHGIEVGAPVFIGEDIVIGLVVHTASSYSFVELITTPGFRASAFVSGPDVVVPIEGVGGGVARVRVPQGVPLVAGNLVYLPSVDPGIYGRITHVVNEPTQPEQYGYISPDVALSGMYQVAVGKQSQIARSTEEVDRRIRKLIEQRLLVPELHLEQLSTSTPTSTEELEVTGE